MGYTHYWEDVKINDLSVVNKNFKTFKRLIKKNYKHVYTAGNKYFVKDLIIQKEYYENSPIVLTNTHCIFNGKDGMGHETFYISTKNETFNFCKTARKPYDFFVTAYLMLLANDVHFTGKITTDGSLGDWEWCYDRLIHYGLVSKKLEDLITF